MALNRQIVSVLQEVSFKDVGASARARFVADTETAFRRASAVREALFKSQEAALKQNLKDLEDAGRKTSGTYRATLSQLINLQKDYQKTAISEAAAFSAQKQRAAKAESAAEIAIAKSLAQELKRAEKEQATAARERIKERVRIEKELTRAVAAEQKEREQNERDLIRRMREAERARTQELRNQAAVRKAIAADEEKARQAAESRRQAAGDVGQAAMIGGAAVGAGIGAAVKIAMDYEAAFKRATLATDGARQKLAELDALARQVGRDTTRTSSEAAQGIEELGKAGVTAQQILDGALMASVRLAEASGVSVQDTSALMATLTGQFGRSASQLNTDINKVIGTIDNSRMSFDDYRNFLGSAGGAAGQFGVSLEDVNAVMAQTITSFSSGQDAGTGYKTFLQRLVPASDDATKAMQALGLMTADGRNQFFTASGEMKSMAEITGLLNTAFGKLTEEQRIQAASTIFGSDAMRTAVSMAKLSQTEFEKLSVKVNTSGDAYQKAAEMAATAEGKWGAFKGSVEDLAISLGNVLLPSLKTAVDGLTGLTNWVNGLPQPIKDTAVVVGTLTAALGLFGGGAVIAMSKGVELIANLKLISGAAGKSGTAGAIDSLTASLSNPNGFNSFKSGAGELVGAAGRVESSVGLAAKALQLFGTALVLYEIGTTTYQLTQMALEAANLNIQIQNLAEKYLIFVNTIRSNPAGELVAQNLKTAQLAAQDLDVVSGLGEAAAAVRGLTDAAKAGKKDIDLEGLIGDSGKANLVAKSISGVSVSVKEAAQAAHASGAAINTENEAMWRRVAAAKKYQEQLQAIDAQRKKTASGASESEMDAQDRAMQTAGALKSGQQLAKKPGGGAAGGAFSQADLLSEDFAKTMELERKFQKVSLDTAKSYAVERLAALKASGKATADEIRRAQEDVYQVEKAITTEREKAAKSGAKAITTAQKEEAKEQKDIAREALESQKSALQERKAVLDAEYQAEVANIDAQLEAKEIDKTRSIELKREAAARKLEADKAYYTESAALAGTNSAELIRITSQGNLEIARLDRELAETRKQAAIDAQTAMIEATRLRVQKDVAGGAQPEIAGLAADITAQQEKLAVLQQYNALTEEEVLRHEIAILDAKRQYANESAKAVIEAAAKEQQTTTLTALGKLRAHQRLIAQLRALGLQETDAFRQAQVEQISLQKTYAAERVQIMQGMFSAVAGLQSSNNKTLVAVGKAAAMAQAIMDGALAVQKALASLPFPANLAAAAAVGVPAAMNVAKIAGVKLATGITEVPRGFEKDNFPANLQSGERVVDRKANADLKKFLAQALKPPKTISPGREEQPGGVWIRREETAKTSFKGIQDQFGGMHKELATIEEESYTASTDRYGKMLADKDRMTAQAMAKQTAARQDSLRQFGSFRQNVAGQLNMMGDQAEGVTSIFQNLYGAVSGGKFDLKKMGGDLLGLGFDLNPLMQNPFGKTLKSGYKSVRKWLGFADGGVISGMSLFDAIKNPQQLFEAMKGAPKNTSVFDAIKNPQQILEQFAPPRRSGSGVVSGGARGVTDGIPAFVRQTGVGVMLDNGEGIIRKRSMQTFQAGEFDLLNRFGREGAVMIARRAMGFADGGVVAAPMVSAPPPNISATGGGQTTYNFYLNERLAYSETPKQEVALTAQKIEEMLYSASRRGALTYLKKDSFQNK